MTDNLITSCPACGGNTLTNINIIIDNIRLKQCEVCGQQVSSCSTEEFKSASNYFDQSRGTAPTGNELRRRERRLNRFLEVSNKLSKSDDHQISYLDIGCSDGFTLEVAQKFGFDSTGVEIAQTPALNAINKGLNVHHGTLEEKNFPPSQFDIITLFEVIEHIASPLSLLQEAHRILKPGGCLTISTGNTRSLTAKKLRESWEYYQFYGHGGHISFFSTHSINWLANRAGFNTKKIITRRVSLTDSTDQNPGLKYLSELIALPASSLGWGHEMIVFLTKTDSV